MILERLRLEVFSEVLIYEFEYDRTRYLYTTLLDIEKEKLKIWFVFHKETTLYLNPKTEEMYLDLEFMNE